MSHNVRIPGSPVATRRINNNNGLRTRREIPEVEESVNPSESVPLVPMNKPPLAGAESTDLDDDRQEVSKPHLGVDDEFFDSNKPNIKDEGNNQVVENINPNHPEEPGYDNDDDIPVITSRAGGDGDSEKPDDVDGARKPSGTQPAAPPNTDFNGRFPYAPSGFGTNIEIGSNIPLDLESIPDVNVYQHKKTLAQGMMDLALFSANANQLRYVLESTSRHPYFYPSVAMISISLIFQVAVGIGLIWNATYNVKDQKEICIANKINNFTVIGIFLVTVINVFISAFGVAAPVTTAPV